jgi:hypothetical protein
MTAGSSCRVTPTDKAIRECRCAAAVLSQPFLGATQVPTPLSGVRQQCYTNQPCGQRRLASAHCKLAMQAVTANVKGLSWQHLGCCNCKKSSSNSSGSCGSTTPTTPLQAGYQSVQ